MATFWEGAAHSVYRMFSFCTVFTSENTIGLPMKVRSMQKSGTKPSAQVS